LQEAKQEKAKSAKCRPARSKTTTSGRLLSTGEHDKALVAGNTTIKIKRRSTLSPLPKASAKLIDKDLMNFARQLEDVDQIPGRLPHADRPKQARRSCVVFDDASMVIPSENPQRISSKTKRSEDFDSGASSDAIEESHSFSSQESECEASSEDEDFKAVDSDGVAGKIHESIKASISSSVVEAQGDAGSHSGHDSTNSTDVCRIIQTNSENKGFISTKTSTTSVISAESSAKAEAIYDDEGFESESDNGKDEDFQSTDGKTRAAGSLASVVVKEIEGSKNRSVDSHKISQSNGPMSVLQQKSLGRPDSASLVQEPSNSSSTESEASYEDEGFESEDDTVKDNDIFLPKDSRQASGSSLDIKSRDYHVRLPESKDGSYYDDSFEMQSDDAQVAIAA